MILKRIFFAIYLKSVFPPYDSNIKFYNATLYSNKNVEIKTSFYQIMAKAKKMLLNTFTCIEFSLIYKKNISNPKKRNNTANLDINWIITIFCSYLRFLWSKLFCLSHFLIKLSFNFIIFSTVAL